MITLNKEKIKEVIPTENSIISFKTPRITEKGYALPKNNTLNSEISDLNLELVLLKKLVSRSDTPENLKYDLEDQLEEMRKDVEQVKISMVHQKEKLSNPQLSESQNNNFSEKIADIKFYLKGQRINVLQSVIKYCSFDIY